MYNVITMKTSIIKIGNSKGVRIPKKILEEVKLIDEANLVIKNGGLFISPASSDKNLRETWGASYSAFAKEWDGTEEDKAWASLQ